MIIYFTKIKEMSSHISPEITEHQKQQLRRMALEIQIPGSAGTQMRRGWKLFLDFFDMLFLYQ